MSKLLPHSHVVYIDEAGDPGVKEKVTTEPSQYDWFVVSAVVVSKQSDLDAVEWVRDMKDAVRGRLDAALHYRNLSNPNRARVCRMLARKRVRIFTVASHKDSMRNHWNRRLGKASDQEFYNWCLRLLLEQVSRFCYTRCLKEKLTDTPAKIVFSERGGHNYGNLRDYLKKLEAQTLTGDLVLKARGIAPGIIRNELCHVRRAADVAGLQLADIAASAFYQAVCSASPNHDIEPAKLLDQRVAIAQGSRTAADFGIMRLPFPHQGSIPLPDRAIFEHYGYKFES